MPYSVQRDPAGKNRSGGDLKEGLLCVARDRGPAALLIVKSVTGLGTRPLLELLPGFSGVVINAGTEGLATLTAAIGVGAIVGGSWPATA